MIEVVNGVKARPLGRKETNSAPKTRESEVKRGAGVR